MDRGVDIVVTGALTNVRGIVIDDGVGCQAVIVRRTGVEVGTGVYPK